MEPLAMFGMVVGTITRNGPSIVVYVAGIVLAAVYWQRNPKVFLLAGLGFAGLLLSLIAGTAFSLVVFPILRERFSSSPAGIAPFSTVYFLAVDFLRAASSACILAALFGPVITPSRFRPVADTRPSSPPPVSG